MVELLTISQLNKIGERLRKNLGTEDDLRKLDEFRVSFEPAYQQVFAELSRLGLNPGGRPQKTTLSIIAKLDRERTLLSKMQDIAGCRVEVENLIEQDLRVDQLKDTFSGAIVIDRRTKPSHGYRAVHVVVEIDERSVEIQIRTTLQHSWASATEKLADVVDPRIKYGAGPKTLQGMLNNVSDVIAAFEIAEKTYLVARSRGRDLRLTEAQLLVMEKDLITVKDDLRNLCQELMINFEELGQ